MNAGTVYQSLREELLGAYTRQVNLVAFGFTATIALIGYNFGAETPNSFIFLFPLVILGLLLVQLNSTMYTIFTISIFIRLFIERKHNIPKWETNIGALRSHLRETKPFKSLIPYNPVTMFDGLIYAFATVAMGLLCIGLSWYYAASDKEFSIATIAAIGWLCIFILLLRPLLFVNTGRYEKELEKEWDQFKKKRVRKAVI